jgi:hypothetical protein
MWNLLHLSIVLSLTKAFSSADQVVYSSKDYIGRNPFQHYYSRPDVWPAAFYINITAAESVSPGYVFLAPWQEGGIGIQQTGPLIMDVHLVLFQAHKT